MPDLADFYFYVFHSFAGNGGVVIPVAREDLPPFDCLNPHRAYPASNELEAMLREKSPTVWSALESTRAVQLATRWMQQGRDYWDGVTTRCCGVVIRVEGDHLHMGAIAAEDCEHVFRPMLSHTGWFAGTDNESS